MAKKLNFDFTEGDTLPILKFEYESVNIVGWSFRLNIATDPATSIVGTITDPYCGLFQFNLGGALPDVGTWEAEIETTDQNTEVLTLRDFQITVHPQIA